MKYNSKNNLAFILLLFLNNAYSFDNPSTEDDSTYFNYAQFLISDFFQYFSQLINNNVDEPSNIYIEVPQQSGADCGFHAVKNGKLLDFLLKSGIRNKQAIEEQMRETGFPQLEGWRIWTQENFDVTDWLNDQEVSVVAEQQAEIVREQFTTIPNIHNFNPVQIAGQEHLLEAIRKLNSQENFQHTFFVGNMPEQVNARGHWITIVAQRKNGKIILRLSDSLGGKHPEIIKRQRKIIESESVFTTMQFTPLFEDIIETTENRLHNRKLRASEKERIRGAIQSLEQVEQQAAMLGFLTDPVWRETYYERTKKLVHEAAERAHGINDENSLERLRPLQYTFCD